MTPLLLHSGALKMFTNLILLITLQDPLAVQLECLYTVLYQ